MSSVQISPNSVMSKPAEVNPLALPAYQQSVSKINEQNNKSFAQVKTDSVIISQEAIAKSLELLSSEGPSDKNPISQINGSAQSNQYQFITKLSDSISPNGGSSSSDEVSISSEAYIKSSLSQVLSELFLSRNNQESAFEKLKL